MTATAGQLAQASTRSMPVFGAALRAEITKAWTLPWTPLIVATSVVAGLLPAVFANAQVSVAGAGAESAGRVAGTFGLSLCVIVFIILAAVIVGSDIRSGELRLGLSAVPGRVTLAAAKLTALAVLVLTTGAGIFLADWVIRRWTDSSSSGRPVASEHLLTGAGFLVAALAFTFVSAALTTLVKNVMVAVAILVLMPLLLVPFLERFAPAISAVLPYNASAAIMTGGGQAEFAIGIAGGFALLITWAAVAGVVYVVDLNRRDI